MDIPTEKIKKTRSKSLFSSNTNQLQINNDPLSTENPQIYLKKKQSNRYQDLYEKIKEARIEAEKKILLPTKKLMDKAMLQNYKKEKINEQFYEQNMLQLKYDHEEVTQLFTK